MNIRDTRTRTLRSLLCLLTIAPLAGCAGWFHDPDAYQTHVAMPESAASLSGQALAQKKARLQRLHRDLVHIRDTAESLRRHGDDTGREQLDRFAAAFVKAQVTPELGKRKQARNAELLPFDANLLFAEADLWLQLRRHGRLSHAIREIEKRFRGREQLPVDYPIGERGSIEEGLRRLARMRKTI